MRRTPWMTYLWPGLPQLWTDGAWWGLSLAVGFGAALDIVLLASVVWTELAAPVVLKAAWAILGGLWAGAAVMSVLFRRTGGQESEQGPAEDLFRDALAKYLCGNWFEAERTLAGLIAQQPRDLEARLMLATLLRHTHRDREAGEELARLERLEGSHRWSQEIAAEWQLLRGADELAGLPAAAGGSTDPQAGGEQLAA